MDITHCSCLHVELGIQPRMSCFLMLSSLAQHEQSQKLMFYYEVRFFFSQKTCLTGEPDEKFFFTLFTANLYSACCLWIQIENYCSWIKFIQPVKLLLLIPKSSRLSTQSRFSNLYIQHNPPPVSCQCVYQTPNQSIHLFHLLHSNRFVACPSFQDGMR